MRRVELFDEELHLLEAGLVRRGRPVEGEEDSENDEDAERGQRRQGELRGSAKFTSDRFDLTLFTFAASECVVEERERQDLERAFVGENSDILIGRLRSRDFFSHA